MSEHYIHELPTGKYRDSTEEEIAAAKIVGARREALVKRALEIADELAVINKDCEHLVCFDVDGWVWTTRTCIACAYSSHL